MSRSASTMSAPSVPWRLTRASTTAPLADNAGAAPSITESPIAITSTTAGTVVAGGVVSTGGATVAGAMVAFGSTGSVVAFGSAGSVVGTVGVVVATGASVDGRPTGSALPSSTLVTE